MVSHFKKWQELKDVFIKTLIVQCQITVEKKWVKGLWVQQWILKVSEKWHCQRNELLLLWS